MTQPASPQPAPEPESGSSEKQPEKQPFPSHLEHKIDFDKYNGMMKYFNPPLMGFLEYLIELMPMVNASTARNIVNAYRSRGYVSRTSFTQGTALCERFRQAIVNVRADDLEKFDAEVAEAKLLIAEGQERFSKWQNDRQGNIRFVEPKRKVVKT